MPNPNPWAILSYKSSQSVPTIPVPCLFRIKITYRAAGLSGLVAVSVSFWKVDLESPDPH